MVLNMMLDRILMPGLDPPHEKLEPLMLATGCWTVVVQVSPASSAHVKVGSGSCCLLAGRKEEMLIGQYHGSLQKWVL